MTKKATPIIQSFNAGELSPLVRVRTDINKYYAGCEVLENFLPLVEGGAKRVPGTYYCMPVKLEDKATRLIPFNPSTQDSYVLEFGHQYIRVYKDGGQIVVNTFTEPEAEDLTSVSSPTSDITKEWTRSTGSDNYALVDDYPIPDDADYVSAPTLQAKTDTYGASFSVPIGSSITKVSLRVRAKVTLADFNRTITPHLRVQGTNYNGASFIPTTTYVNYNTDWATNPRTSLAWTWEDINGLSSNVLQGFGYVSGMQARVVYVSQCFATVYYRTPTIADYNPYQSYYESQYVKLGPYITLDFGDEKKLYVIAKWRQAEAANIKVAVDNVPINGGGDELVVSAADNVITITIANATSTRNAANAIAHYLRELGTVDGVDVSEWIVMESAEYAAARPVAASIAEDFLADNEQVFQANREVTVTTFSPQEVTNISNADPAVVTVTGHSLDDGTLVYIEGVAGMPEVNDKLFTVTGVDPDTFELDGCDSSAYGTYSSGGFVTVFNYGSNYFPPVSPTQWREIDIIDPVEIVTPYREEDLAQLKRAVSNDVMYLFHPDYPPAKLIRYSHVQWEYNVVGFIGTENIQRQGELGFAKTIILISQANPGVVTCRSHGFKHGDRVYINHCLGMLEVNGNIYTVANPTTHNFQLQDTDTTGFSQFYVDDGGYKPGTVIKVVDVFKDAGDYPSCGVFHNQRLCLGGFKNQPLTFKLSNIAEYERFISDAKSPDGAIDFKLVADKVNRIRWIAGVKDFIIGTTGGIWMVGAASQAEAFSQTNVNAERTVSIGVANIEPRVSNDALMWVTRAGTSLRLFMYSLEEDRWVAPDMMRIADHIALGVDEDNSGITEMDFQQEPYPILWARRRDGQFLGLTLNAQEQVYGWFRVPIDGTVESLCVSSQDNREDEVWLIVKREINGVTRQYVEYFKPHRTFGQLEDSFYVHCGLSYSGVPRSIFTNLDHLEGKDVKILADGVVKNATVISGVIGISPAASKVHIGLANTARISPMPIHTGSAYGSSVGKVQKVHRVTVCFHETAGGKYGPTFDDLKPIPFDDITVMNTENVEAEFHGDWVKEANVCIEQDEPLPMTILAMIPRVTLEEQ